MVKSIKILDTHNKNRIPLLYLLFKNTINPLQLFIFTNVIRCSRLPL